MIPNPERGRLAMHVLVDIMSSYDQANPDAWQGAIDAALPRLLEIEAIEVKVQDQPDSDDLQVDLDASGVLIGGAVVIMRLVHQLALAEGVSDDDVIVRLRDWIDEDLRTRPDV